MRCTSSNDDGSKWDAFFHMGKSVTFSDNEDNSMNSQSSASVSCGNAKAKLRWRKSSESEESDGEGESESGSESELVESSESEYDSDIENKRKLPKRLPFRFRRKKDKPTSEDSDDEDESIHDEHDYGTSGSRKDDIEDDRQNDNKSNKSAFSNYANRINSSNIEMKGLTLIPIGGSAQANYMVLTPKSGFENNVTQILSPQSIRSVSLKKGLSNNTVTSRKQIFKMKTKKAPEKKQFLKVNPRILEEKYDKMKKKARARMEQIDNRMYTDRNYAKAEGLNQPLPLLDRLELRDSIEDEFENDSISEDDAEVSTRKKKHDLDNCEDFSVICSISENHNGKSVDSASIESQEKAKNCKNNPGQKQEEPVRVEIAQPFEKEGKTKRSRSFKNLFLLGKLKGVLKKGNANEIKQSDSSVVHTQLGPNKVLSMVRSPVKTADFALLKENDTIQNEMVVYYHFGGEAKTSMDHIKKKEDLIPGEKSEEVLIQVEASTVSQTDCHIRNERLWAKSGKAILPVTPGVDFIGKVVKCGEMATLNYGINVDDRVASLIQTGGNCKYLLEHANQLVLVPKTVKAYEAAVMVEVYLSAFQILLMGVTGRDRYQSRPLQGKEILILGGICTVNQAMIELAAFMGARNVYTTALPKHCSFLQELGATTLDIRMDNWLPIVEGKIDLAVDSLCEDNYDSSWKALHPKGKLICNGMQTIISEESGCINSFEQMWARTKSACMPRTQYYDVYNYWEKNLEESKEDLEFIFKLLEQKKLNPSIADTLPLRKVPKAHAFLDASRRIQGTFVCLPHSEG